MQKLAVVTGTTTEKISALVSVAKLSNTEVGQVEAGMVRLAAALSKAGEESKEPEKRFRCSNSTPTNYAAWVRPKPCMRVARRSPKSRRLFKTALAVAIFGKAGAELLPYLEDLAANGALVAKVTTEQGRRQKNTRKSEKTRGGKSAVAKTICRRAGSGGGGFRQDAGGAGRGANDVNGAVKRGR